MINNTQAIILAAGQGTRLKKYTENLPKGMLKFQGKTIIERQIDIYHQCGIDKIIIVTGFASEKINYQNIKYFHNTNFSTTNMVESLMTAKSEFTTDTIISYSDILFEKKMLNRMINAKGDFLVAVDKCWKTYWHARYGKINFDVESLSLDCDNNILEIGKDNPNIDLVDARYIGLLKFSKFGLNLIQEILNRDYKEYADKPWKQSGKTIRNAYMTDLLQAIIDSGNKVKAEIFNSGWIEFDTNEDYEKACHWVDEESINRFINLGEN